MHSDDFWLCFRAELILIIPILDPVSNAYHYCHHHHSAQQFRKRKETLRFLLIPRSDTIPLSHWESATKNRFRARNECEIIAFAVMQFADNWYVSIRDSREVIKWPNKDELQVGTREKERARERRTNKLCLRLAVKSKLLLINFNFALPLGACLLPADWVGPDKDNNLIRLAGWQTKKDTKLCAQSSGGGARRIRFLFDVDCRVSSLKFKFASVLGWHFSDDSSRQTNRQSHNLIVQNPIRSKKKIKENTVARGEMYNYDVR